MKTMARSLAHVALIVFLAVRCGVSQSAPTEKHVADIMAVQTKEAILASPLCQQTREHSSSVSHWLAIDPATLAPDLASLMEDSDEVVLVGQSYSDTVAISPSGKDVAKYFDAKVLRTWKGSHKAGDIITYAIPIAYLRCGEPREGAPIFWAGPEADDWGGPLWGPKILFLRQSRGQEAQLIPGFRLTGGNGLQGAYVIPFDLHDSSCSGVLPGGAGGLRARLETSQTPISGPYLRDPLLKAYGGMPISRFLKEVQSEADSLGYRAHAEVPK